jgi:uncharacterized protein (TIGR00661 family)
MKYVFIVQGEGRGHLTQAISLERLLLENGHTVAAILVGKSPARKLPVFFTSAVSVPVESFDSFNFVPSASNRKASILKTALYNLLHITSFFPSIRFIRDRLRALKPDVVVNFYDILGTLGYARSGLKSPMVCVAHQFLFLHRDFRFPRCGYEDRFPLNLFTRMVGWRAAKILALSFRKMEDDLRRRIKVVPPLLRPAVLALRHADGTDDPLVRDGGYIHGYMLNPGFSADILDWHACHPEVELRFFWDKADEPAVKVVDGKLSFYYLDDVEFLRQMAGCHAYASTAGFESICEAMYLGKPLLMVPSHVEQKCNAFDATEGFRFTRPPREAPGSDSEAASVPSIRPAVAADSFDLDKLLAFAEHDFVPDTAFPAWARSADTVFLRELTTFP